MAHFRKQLRDGIRARLQAALAAAGMDVKVFAGRMVPLRAAECPAINIVTTGTMVNSERKNVERIERGVPITIMILVSAAQDEAQDEIDEISVVVEQALAPSRDWSLPVKSFAQGDDTIDIVPGQDGAIAGLASDYFAELLHPMGRPSEPHNFRNPTGA